MGVTALANHFIDAGWGTWGFKATPVAGKRMAELIATGRVPEIIRPFALDRFNQLRQIMSQLAISKSTSLILSPQVMQARRSSLQLGQMSQLVKARIR